MADITTTRVFTDGEKGITAAKMNDIIGSSSIQTSFVSAKPVASSTVAGDNLLLLTSGGTYAKIDSSVFSSSIAALLPAPEPKIWDVRLRSYNAVGNPNFEVDQRNIHTAVVNPAAGTLICDRWAGGNTALNPTFRSIQTGLGAGQGIPVPGTSYTITTAEMIVTIGTQKTSLAATDHLDLQQTVEGSSFRELMSDVHSLQLLVRSSVANLKFGIALRDPTASRSLTKLCSLGAANTLTLIQLPNLPVWPSAGTFTASPGSAAYLLNIVLAAGTTFVSPANDTWQTGNFLGAVGQSNFLASTVGSTFEVFFVQHEPLSQCSQLLDCSFGQNLDGCLKYYCKSYDYDVKPGTASTNSYATFVWPYNIAGAFTAYGGRSFPKPMAKVPTVAAYNNSTGTINTAFEYYCPTTYGLAFASGSASVTGTTATKNGVQALISTGTSPGPITLFAEWTADTSW